MKVKDFIKWVTVNEIPDDYEIYVSNNNVSDIRADEVNKKLILRIENALEKYYAHKSKMGILNDMIECTRLDGVIAISELEIVEIAHDLQLSYEDVKREFEKNNIDVEEI